MQALEWIFKHQQLVTWLALASFVLFLAGLFAVRAWAVHLPADFFSPQREREALMRRSSASGFLIMVLRNLLGLMLVLVGVAMLILPGPGVLAVVVGILAMDFPGKMHLARWLVSRPAVLVSINFLRKRAGRKPLILDPAPR